MATKRRVKSRANAIDKKCNTENLLDWPISPSLCRSPPRFENVRCALGFTIRNSEYLETGATSFANFKRTQKCQMVESLFQSFIYLCQGIKNAVSQILHQKGKEDSEIDNNVEFWLESIQHAEYYLEDLKDSRARTSSCGYTFWMFLYDTEDTARIEVESTWINILKHSSEYCKKVSGGNEEELSRILKDVYDPSNSKRDGEGNVQYQRVKYSRFYIGDLPRHEKWKLVKDAKYIEATYDYMTLQQFWGHLAFSPQEKVQNIEKAIHIFNPLLAMATRPCECVLNQTPFNARNMIRKEPESDNWSVGVPLRKFMLKIPADIMTIESIINRKLLDYQAVSLFNSCKMGPILLEKMEKCLEEEMNYNSHIWEGESTEQQQDISISEEYDREELVQEYESATLNQSITGDYTTDSNHPDLDGSQDDRVSTDLEEFTFTASSDPNNTEEFFSHDTIPMIIEDDDCPTVEQEQQDQLETRTEGDVRFVASSIPKLNLDVFHMNNSSESVPQNGATDLNNSTDTSFQKSDPTKTHISIYTILCKEYEEGKQCITSFLKRIESNKCRYPIFNVQEAARKLTILLKRHMNNQYKYKCLSTSALGISPYERAYLEYHEVSNAFQNAKMIVHSKRDDELGIFENSELQMYGKLQLLEHVTANHRPIASGIKVSCDSSRFDWGLHLNIIYHGDVPSTGKTNITNTVIEHSIQGTCITGGYNSQRSDLSTEPNLNAGTMILPEIAFSELDDNRFNGYANRQKDRMTSGVTTFRRLQLDEKDNTYKSVYYRSEQQGATIANCNWNPTSLTAPVKSREILMEIFESDKDVLEDVAAMKMRDSTHVHERELFKRENKLMQLMIFHVERMIKIGALEQVTEDIGWIFMIVLSKILKSKGISIGTVRTPQKIIILARQNCIRESVERNWFQNGSKYSGKTITTEQFLDLDKKLFLTTNHIVSAIGEIHETVVDPTIDHVRTVLSLILSNISKGSKFRRKQSMADKHRDNGVKVMTRDYNYFRLGNKTDDYLKDVANTVCNTSKTHIGIKLEYQAVREVLNSWSKLSITCPNYEPNRKASERISDNIVDGLMEEAEMNELRKLKSKTERKIISQEGNSCLLLYHYFNPLNITSSLDILKESIEEILSSKHQLEGTYLFDNDKDFPFIRNCIRITTNGTKLISYPAVNLTKGAMEDMLKEHDDINDDERFTMTDEEWENADNTGGPIFIEGDEINENQYDVTSVGYDLNSLSLKRRNKTLRITESAINSDFLRYDLSKGCFTNTVGNDTRVYDSKTCFHDDDDYDNEQDGYFMGRPIRDANGIEGILTKDQMRKNLIEFYKILNKVDKNSDDVDFNRSDYAIDNMASADEGKKSEFGHWLDMLEPLNNEYEYKLMCEHPLVVNKFFNTINSKLCNPKGIYPETIRQSYIDAKKSQDILVGNVDTKKMDEIIRHVSMGKLYIHGYKYQFDSKGRIKDVNIDRSDPYQSVGLAFGKRDISPSPMEWADE